MKALGVIYQNKCSELANLFVISLMAFISLIFKSIIIFAKSFYAAANWALHCEISEKNAETLSN